MGPRRVALGAVDVDAATTWPDDIRRHSEEIANEVRGRFRYVSDMEVCSAVADEFLGFFVARLLRAYHATRLLDHELDMIRSQGLRILEEGLIVERIENACDLGHISSAEKTQLAGGHVFAEGRSRGRAGHVSLFISRSPLDRRVSGVRPLLRTWGGEGMYMARGGHALRQRLGELGKPTIAVVDVDLGPDARVHGIYPEFVETLRRSPSWA